MLPHTARGLGWAKGQPGSTDGYKWVRDNPNEIMLL